MATKKITQLPSGSFTPPLSGVTTVVYSGTTHQQNLSTLRQILVDSGSHNFSGSQLFNGDIIVTGSIYVSGNFIGDGSQLTNLPTGSGEINISNLATTGSNAFNGDQIINGFVSASNFQGDGSALINLLPINNWVYDNEIVVKNNEQLTFSGDYVLENSFLLIEGDDIRVEYSPNKYFEKMGKIFIGGNILVKDSYIVNNGKLSVGGQIILIGDSQIVGTGTII